MTTSLETSDEGIYAIAPTAARSQEGLVSTAPVSANTASHHLVGTNLMIENEKVEFVKGKDTMKRYDVSIQALL